MPLYSVYCILCGKEDVMFRRIADRHNTPLCCDEHMLQKIEAPAIQTDIPAYQSPIDGRWINGKADRREDLKRHNCRPWEGMAEEKKAAERRANEADATFSKKIEKGLYDTYNNMSAEKQRKLLKEF